MIDEEKEVVEETQEVEQVEEQQEEQQPEAPKESPQAKNFRELRERADRLERERDDANRRARDLESRTSNKVQTVEDDDDDIRLSDDELVEGKHISKIAKKYKEIKKELNEFKQQAATMNDETRLKYEMPDIEKVVTTDNMRLLEELEPEVAEMLRNSSGSLYTRGKAAYKMLKKYNIAKDSTYDAEKELIRKNTSKPKPLASVSAQRGESPLEMANAFANGMTPELEKKLMDEMNEACSRY